MRSARKPIARETHRGPKAGLAWVASSSFEVGNRLVGGVGRHNIPSPFQFQPNGPGGRTLCHWKHTGGVSLNSCPSPCALSHARERLHFYQAHANGSAERPLRVEAQFVHRFKISSAHELQILYQLHFLLSGCFLGRGISFELQIEMRYLGENWDTLPKLGAIARFHRVGFYFCRSSEFEAVDVFTVKELVKY